MSNTLASKSSFARNILSNWGVVFFVAVTSFFLSPFLVHRLGDSVYGIWVLLGSLVGYMGLLDFGIRGAVTRYIAHYFAANKHGQASRIASVALGLFVGVGVVVMLLVFVACMTVDRLFEIPPVFLTDARIVLCTIGFALAVSIVGGVYGGVVVGVERFDLLNATEVAAETLRVLLVVMALSMGYGLVALAVVQLTCSILRTASQAVLARRVYPQLRLTFTSWGMQEAREILSFGAFSSLLSLSTRLRFHTDSIVISSFLPVAFVTLFSIGAMLTLKLLPLSMAISTLLTPRVSALEARGEWELLRYTVLRMGRISTLIILPGTITFLIRGPSFIALWMGPEYAELSGEILRILALALSFAAGARVVGAAMLGLNRHRGLVPAEFAEAALNLGLSIVLIGPLSIAGVALGTAIPNLLMSLVFLPWYAQRVIKLKVANLFVQFWLRPALAMVPFGALTAVFEQVFPADNLLTFFLQLAVALPVAVLGVYAVALDHEERMFVRARLGFARAWERGPVR